MHTLSIFRIARIDRAGITVIAGVDEPRAFCSETGVCCRTRISVIAFVGVVVRRERACTRRLTTHVFGARISIITRNGFCRANALLTDVAGRALITVVARSVRSGCEHAAGFLIASVRRARIAVITENRQADANRSFAHIRIRTSTSVAAIKPVVCCEAAISDGTVALVDGAIVSVFARLHFSFALVRTARIADSTWVLVIARCFVLHRVEASEFLVACVERAVEGIVTLKVLSGTNTQLAGIVVSASVVIAAR